MKGIEFINSELKNSKFFILNRKDNVAYCVTSETDDNLKGYIIKEKHNDYSGFYWTVTEFKLPKNERLNARHMDFTKNFDEVMEFASMENNKK